MTLIEPLERRVEFLQEAVVGLDIEVIRGRSQDVKATAHYVTARAVAPLREVKENQLAPFKNQWLTIGHEG